MIAVPETRSYNLGWLRSYITQIQPLLGFEEPITVWDHYPRHGRAIAADVWNGLSVADEFFALLASDQRNLIVGALLDIMLEDAALNEGNDQLIENLVAFIAPRLPPLDGA